VDVAGLLLELGGVATRATLVRCTSRSAVDRALAAGQLVAVARGRYALPAADEAVAAPHARPAVLSHTSAAIHHGWAVKQVPARPHVTVRRDRRPPTGGWGAVHVHYATLDAGDIVDGVATGKVLTLQQCLRSLPFDEVDDLSVEPQVLITSVEPWCRPDLGDLGLRIVLEADSFAWHGDRAALAADARRYNLLVADGWLVLRFAWEHVMLQPEHVRTVLEAVVAQRLRPRTAA
jgi:hypothetical protein